MKNLTFREIFRYVLGGGIILGTLFAVYDPPDPGDDSRLDISSLGGAALLSVAALVIGGLLYSIHRAFAYPLIYRLLLLIGPLRHDSKRNRDWAVVWPSTEETERDIARWEKRKDNDSAISGLSEWATQIHYLYCSAWAILVAHLTGTSLAWAVRGVPCRLSLGLALITFVAGVYHHARYLYFEAKILAKPD